jgi:hypothetical protein
MTRWVRNSCYGGFGLSKEAVELYNQYAGTDFKDSYAIKDSVARNDPNLVNVVEILQEKANGDCAELKIVEIPDDVEPELQEYDGWETFVEPHRSW